MKKTFCFAIAFAFCTISGFTQFTALISGKIVDLKHDSVKLILHHNFITHERSLFNVPAVNGHFSKQISLTEPTYVSVTDGTNYINGFIEPGDSIVLSYNATDSKNTVHFSGKGNEKFTCINRFR
jgi:hypothetical protein